MTKRLLRSAPAACVFGFFLLASPGAAYAQNQPCETTCNPSVPCHRQCVIDPYDWPREYTTCGNWGSCNYCTPNWQVVSSGPALGLYYYNLGQPQQCNTYRWTRVVERDMNACNPGYLERHYCTNPQVVNLALGCCWFGCSPETYDLTNCN